MTEPDFYAVAKSRKRWRGTACTTGAFVERMQRERPDLADGIVRALGDPSISASDIMEACRKFGYELDVATDSVNRHRRGACRFCPTPMSKVMA